LVGAALAEFHACLRPGLVELSTPTRRNAAQSHAATISTLCPALAAEAGRVAGLVEDALGGETRIVRRLHGDFHPRQMLVDGRTVAFLDLDAGLAGHPSVDVGSFLAHLEREAIRGHMPARRVEQFAESLMDGYESAGGVQIRECVPRAVAIGLLRLAPRCFRHRELDWPVQMATLLKRAEEVAHGQSQAAA
jgi:hypothetical protein